MTDDARPASVKGPSIAAGVALVLYLVSTSPVVHWGDSAEFARRAARLELSPVARGYPLHRLLTWAAGRAMGDPALGANVVSAIFGAVTIGLVYAAARRLARSEWAGASAAIVTGLALTFWAYSAVAEAYTLHTALMVGAILVAIAADSGDARTRVGLGLVLGLSLLHHRMIVFVLPGIALWMWTGTTAGSRVRALLQVVAGAFLGAVPFIVLCVVASRTPPPDANRVWWWFQDVFLGGEQNAGFILGEGRKGLGTSAVYVAKWIALNLPGPTLVLATVGFVVAGRRVAWFLGVLALAHLWFPLRYDWTGDQYTFLIPLYPIVAIAVGVAVAWLARTRGPRPAAVAAASVAIVPIALYLLLAFTSLGSRAMPRLRREAMSATFWPVRHGQTVSRDWCIERLERMPRDARLHCDWGDGEVYLYLQEVEGLRRDVTIDLWYRDMIRLGDGRGEEWLSALPFSTELPRLVQAALPRLEPMGDGLFRVRPE